jgi:hypothetical protein
MTNQVVRNAQVTKREAVKLNPGNQSPVTSDLFTKPSTPGT